MSNEQPAPEQAPSETANPEQASSEAANPEQVSSETANPEQASSETANPEQAPSTEEPASDEGRRRVVRALFAHKPGAEPSLGVAAASRRLSRALVAIGWKKAAPEEAAAAGDPGSEPPTSADDQAELPNGNKLRLRGLAILIPCLLAALGVMSYRGHVPGGLPLGALFVLGATFGTLDFLGTFDDPDTRIARTTQVTALARPAALTFAGLFGIGLFVSLAVVGILGPVTMAVLMPAAFVTTCVGVFRVLETLGLYQEDRIPLHKRHGFWLAVLHAVVLLPMLGSHSLVDPWETHYGEVAREILARDDWISLWWAQEQWFWSKPIFDFWMQALAMLTFGVRFGPGQMLSAFGEGRVPWPEWAVRLPVFLLAFGAAYVLYKAVSRVFGRRAGFLGGVVLLTMPQWFMVAHQTMTDMPFVATMAAAMGFLLLGIHADPTDKARSYAVRIGKIELRLTGYHLVFGAVLLCALPQVLYLFSRNIEIVNGKLRFVFDSFASGSAGNCTLPGNDPCKSFTPVLAGLQPALQGLVWLQAIALLLHTNWGERRVQRLYFIAAWLCAALSTMAKGPAGFGLPVLCVLAYVIVARRHKDLTRMEILSGLLVLLCVALPWFLAMFVRHGQPFTDRLLFHDMYKRAFTHVHDTNEGDDVSFRFYLWQLGYAVFPWTGVVPAAIVAWRRRARAELADGTAFFAMWFGLSFGLFALMLTKFHHYILPAVPAAAMLTGIFLDDISKPATAEQASAEERHSAVMGSAAAIVGAIVVLVVGADLVWAREGQPSEARLMHLFTYNYKRSWPQGMTFQTGLLIGIVAAAGCTWLVSVGRIRKQAVTALSVVAVGFAAFVLDVYFVRLSPHWGQREVIAAYYTERVQTPGPIIAYQMNWKGENFYTGNQIPAFVTSGKKFQDYISDLKKAGQKTFYFVTEPHRVGHLSSELGFSDGAAGRPSGKPGAPRSFDKVTTAALNNKFVLVRASFD